MEKQAGWGKDVPEEIRNGDWQYQAFTTAREPNPKAVLAACFKCHKPLDKQDFVFSWNPLRGGKCDASAIGTARGAGSGQPRG